MGVARYILSRLSSLLATLPASKRVAFFTPALPALVRFCRAFPPLCDEATGFLLELGRVAASHASASVGHPLGKSQHQSCPNEGLSTVRFVLPRSLAPTSFLGFWSTRPSSGRVWEDPGNEVALAHGRRMPRPSWLSQTAGNLPQREKDEYNLTLWITILYASQISNSSVT